MVDYLGQLDEIKQDPHPFTPDWHPLLRKYRAIYTRQYFLTGDYRAARRVVLSKLVAEIMIGLRQH